VKGHPSSHRRLIAGALVLALAALAGRAADLSQAGLKPDGHLDMDALRAAYTEGGFAQVRGVLEGFMKRHPQDVSPEEKVFTHRYLGAICAADSAARPLAEAHFRALLKLSPEADVSDLYLPPRIQDLFDRTKRDVEQEENRKRLEAASPHSQIPFTAALPPEPASLPAPAAGAGRAPASVPGLSAPAPAPRPADKTAVIAEEGNAWVWWTVGSAAVITAGAGIYAITAHPAPAPKRTEVDATLK
jgi:hypothetical protein